MAETTYALQEWSKRTKSTEGFVSDCLDSFIQGKMGRPFAEMKRPSAMRRASKQRENRSPMDTGNIINIDEEHQTY
jgi:hypothetical protein